MAPQVKLSAWVAMMMSKSFEDGLPQSFFDVASEVYKNDPNWIPENIDGIKQQFSPHNAYFNDGLANVFVKEGVARLAGFFNPNVLIEGEQVAYFGFWETHHELPVNQALFSKFERWAASCGATSVYGPINFNTFQSNRLRVDSFHTAPFIDEPYNPDYYPELLHALGYQSKYDYVTALNTSVDTLVDQISSPFKAVKSSIPEAFSFEHLTGDVWMENLKQLYPLVDAIFQENFAYTKISWESFKLACGDRFAKKLCPKTSVIVWDKDRNIAGFFITYPDYSSLVNQSTDDPESIQNVSYQKHYSQLKQPRLLLAKTRGVAPKYRSYKLFPLMSMQLTLWAKGLYEHIASAMVRDDNVSMSFYKSLEAGGNQDFVTRRYRLFSKALSVNEVPNE